MSKPNNILLFVYLLPAFLLRTSVQLSPCCSLSNSTQAVCRKDGTFQRLPPHVVPSNYAITMQPIFDNFTFLGTETILLNISKPTDALKFHLSEIDITEATLFYGNESFTHLKIDYDELWMMAEARLPKTIGPGNAELFLKFTGTLNDKLKGFYRSSYKDKDGEKRYLATTQFESTGARQAFPCWDEPAYKATFDITLIVPKEKTALSNTQEESVTDTKDGWKTVKFARSPIMSTYLVAFVVGDLEYIEGFSDRGVRLRVYTIPGKVELGRFALEFAGKALSFYEKYFGINYVLPKCDLVAIPDFEMGAMENWGLITYQEISLLFDAKTTSASVKQDIATVIAHELAHMWFGNLVTMKWWTDLFLKEGFARWMENFCVNHIFPEYDLWNQFVSQGMSGAMELDSLRNSHPIEVPIEDPAEVNSIYDSVSYSKSASVIRMLTAYIGDEALQRGLREYLTKYSYKNAVAENLWQCLSNASGKDIAQVCSMWTKVMGYPMLEVSLEEKNGKRFLKFEQRRFLDDGSEDEKNTIWQVPILIHCDVDKEVVNYLLTQKMGQLELSDKFANASWLKVNSNYTGYYRVKYSNDLLLNLLKHVQSKELSAADRFGIVSDSFAFVRSGLTSTSSFLNMLQYYENETDFNVWTEIDSSLVTLRNCLERIGLADELAAFIRKLYSKVYARMGSESVPNESHTETMLRPIIMRRLGESGDKNVIAEAKKQFKRFLEGEEVSADIRGTVFALVNRHGGDEAFDQLLKIYQTTKSDEVKRDCMLAFGQSSSKAALQRTMDLLLTDEVRLQDIGLVVSGIVKTPVGQDIAWDFFTSKKSMILLKLGSATSSLFVEVVELVVRNQCSETMAKTIEDFFESEKLNNHAVCRKLHQSLENVRLNAALLNRDGQALKMWFGKY